MLETLFAAISVAIPVIQAAVASRLQYRDEALLALYTALAETQAHLQKQRRRGEPDAPNERLAELWFRASLPLRHFNIELANLCDHKRDYWSNPSHWAGDDRIDSNIRLEAMRQRFDTIKANVLSAFVSLPTKGAKPPHNTADRADRNRKQRGSRRSSA